MNTKISTRSLARGAILLALCVAVQQFKNVSQFITGPLVNTILILSALMVGLWGGVIIACLSPLLAFLIAPSAVLQAVPVMIPIIMVGNVLIVLAAYAAREGETVQMGIALVIGSVLKALFLWLATTYFAIPVFGSQLPDQMKAMMGAMFSYNQLITALIGSVLVLLVWWKLKEIIHRA